MSADEAAIKIAGVKRWLWRAVEQCAPGEYTTSTVKVTMPRLALLVDREAPERDSRRFAALLRFARLRQRATPEDVGHRADRGLDRALFGRLTAGAMIERHQNLLVTGSTGTGKTWLSCALGHRACRDNHSVLYQRMPRLLEALGLARGDGRQAPHAQTAHTGVRAPSHGLAPAGGVTSWPWALKPAPVSPGRPVRVPGCIREAP